MIQFEDDSATFHPPGQSVACARLRELREVYEITCNPRGRPCGERMAVAVRLGRSVWIIPAEAPGASEFYRWFAPWLRRGMVHHPVLASWPREWLRGGRGELLPQVQPETTIPVAWIDAGYSRQPVVLQPRKLPLFTDLFGEYEPIVVVDENGEADWRSSAFVRDSTPIGVPCSRIIRICYRPYPVWRCYGLLLACFGEYALLYPDPVSNTENLLRWWGIHRLERERRLHFAHADWLPPTWRNWWRFPLPPSGISIKNYHRARKYATSTFYCELPQPWRQEVALGMRWLSFLRKPGGSCTEGVNSHPN